MKKLFFIGFIALLAIACGSKKTEEKKGDETKTEETKKESSLKNMIVGTWVITSVGGETAPEGADEVVFTFKADGTATGTGEADAKWEAKEKDGKKYIIITTDKVEETEIKSIDDKKMVLSDKGEEIVLTKK